MQQQKMPNCHSQRNQRLLQERTNQQKELTIRSSGEARTEAKVQQQKMPNYHSQRKQKVLQERTSKQKVLTRRSSSETRTKLKVQKNLEYPSQSK